MTDLTAEERQFLKEYRIPLSNLFDASGYRRVKDYQAQMKEDGIGFAFGTKPCGAGGHKLRTRKGHCIMCRPDRISYYMRYRSEGFVYIAGSLRTKFIKVGMTTDLTERLNNLKAHQYGTTKDWEMLATVRTKRAGECEYNVHQALDRYRADGTYTKAGKPYVCYELFSCGFKIAEKALRESLPSDCRTAIERQARAQLHS